MLRDTVHFTVYGSLTGARRGALGTPHGDIQTPAYVPLARHGAVGSLRVSDLLALGVQAIAVSLYGLDQRPGLGVIEKVGGLHAFTGWNGPLLADPGDREVTALASPVAEAGQAAPHGRKVRGERARLLKRDADSAVYTSYVDGARIALTPADSVRAQARLGADLGRSPWVPPTDALLLGPGRGWSSLAAAEATALGFPLLGTLDGADAPIAAVLSHLPGYAYLNSTSDGTAAWPDDAGVRVVEGASGPSGLLAAWAHGADLVSGDTFLDAARAARAFTPHGPLSLLEPTLRLESAPIQFGCDCPTCSFASRGYLRHLYVCDEMAAPTLVALHNLAFIMRLERAAREWLVAGRFEAERAAFLADYAQDAGKGASA